MSAQPKNLQFLLVLTLFLLMVRVTCIAPLLAVYVRTRNKMFIYKKQNVTKTFYCIFLLYLFIVLLYLLLYRFIVTLMYV